MCVIKQLLLPKIITALSFCLFTDSMLLHFLLSLFPLFSPSLPSITDVCLTSVHQSGSLAASRNIYFLDLGRLWCTSDVSAVSLHNRNVKGLRWKRHPSISWIYFIFVTWNLMETAVLTRSSLCACVTWRGTGVFWLKCSHKSHHASYTEYSYG